MSNNDGRLSWEFAARNHNRSKCFRHITKTDFRKSLSRELLLAIGDVKGKNVLQPFCNDGRELCGLLQLGAASCVGVDYSEPSIEWARNTVLGCLPNVIRFDNANVFSWLPAMQEQFDLIVITEGSLSWVPNLRVLFSYLHDRLSINGRLVIFEFHSNTRCLNCRGVKVRPPVGGGRRTLHRSGIIDYVGDGKRCVWWTPTRKSVGVYVNKFPIYEFSWAEKDVVEAVRLQGLRIDSYSTFPYVIREAIIPRMILKTKTQFWINGSFQPLMYALVARSGLQER